MSIVRKELWANRYILLMAVLAIVFSIIENVYMSALDNRHLLSTDFNILLLHFVALLVFISILVFFSITVKRRSTAEFLIGVFLLVMAALNLYTMYSVNTVFGTPTNYEILDYVTPFYSVIDKYRIDEITGEAVNVSRSWGKPMTTIAAIASTLAAAAILIFDIARAGRRSLEERG